MWLGRAGTELIGAGNSNRLRVLRDSPIARGRPEEAGKDRVDDVLDRAEDEERTRSSSSRASARSWAARTVSSSATARLTEGGQAHAAAAADEERVAELLLEQADVTADRGLGQVERLGGAAVPAITDDRLQRADVGGVDIQRMVSVMTIPRRSQATDKRTL